MAFRVINQKDVAYTDAWFGQFAHQFARERLDGREFVEMQGIVDMLADEWRPQFAEVLMGQPTETVMNWERLEREFVASLTILADHTDPPTEIKGLVLLQHATASDYL